MSRMITAGENELRLSCEKIYEDNSYCLRRIPRYAQDVCARQPPHDSDGPFAVLLGSRD
jgi:hypothetical protein